MRGLLVALAAALTLALAASEASAQPKQPPGAKPPSKDAAPGRAKKRPAPSRYRAVVLVLHATNTKKGIDKRIRKMRELKNPPFSSYDSYQLLARRSLGLKKGKPRSIRLPNGRVLQAELLEVLPKGFVRISASINRPGGKTFLPLLEVKAKLGQAFIVAGQSYKNGILVLVIRVAEQPVRRRRK